MLEKRICKKCYKEFEVDIKSKRRFCSRSCANSHKFSNETKKKISDKILKRLNNGEKTGYVKKDLKLHYCKICGKQLISNSSKFCSVNCKRINKFYKSLVKYFGLSENNIGSDIFINEIQTIKQNLYDLYWNKEYTSIEICKMFNYPNIGNLTGKIFKYLGISPKSCKSRNKESVFYHKKEIEQHNIYKCGWHTTWDSKEVYLRSSYELDYAKQLDEQQIEYEVENLRIKYFDSQKQDFRCAIPDFYLPKTNEIVEIKSNWTLNKQNMKDKFNAYVEQGYKPKLILNKQEVKI